MLAHVGQTRLYEAPWWRSFPPTHRHRIRLVTPTCWTLVYTGPIERTWGFWTRDGFVSGAAHIDEGEC